MPVNVTLLGLGRVGGSLALALKAQPELRVSGYDKVADIARFAQSRGVVQKAYWNLFSAIEGADLVLLTTPLDEQREILQLVGPDLRPGSVTASVGPLLSAPLAWAAASLATPERHFVAAHAVLNPSQLHTGESGYEAAAADLFKGGLWALAPAPGCAPEALKLLADLARLLEAFPYYVDPAEHDGLSAASEGLPAVLAWALLQAATTSPGWAETRKVADRALATATAALVDVDATALRLNRANVLRYLDAALAELQLLRERLAADDGPAVRDALEAATARREAWLADRRRGDWEAAETPATDLPTSGEMFGRMFLGGLAAKRKDQ
jgi:prephenate dehydrogenase